MQKRKIYLFYVLAIALIIGMLGCFNGNIQGFGVPEGSYFTKVADNDWQRVPRNKLLCEEASAEHYYIPSIPGLYKLTYFEGGHHKIVHCIDGSVTNTSMRSLESIELLSWEEPECYISRSLQSGNALLCIGDGWASSQAKVWWPVRMESMWAL
jgi:hypothetical protein